MRLRVSPGKPFTDITEDDTHAICGHLVTDLARLDLAYLHVVHAGDDELLRFFRDAWAITLIVNRAGRPREEISVDVDSGVADSLALLLDAGDEEDLVVHRANRTSNIITADERLAEGSESIPGPAA